MSRADLTPIIANPSTLRRDSENELQYTWLLELLILLNRQNEEVSDTQPFKLCFMLCHSSEANKRSNNVCPAETEQVPSRDDLRFKIYRSRLLGGVGTQARSLFRRPTRPVSLTQIPCTEPWHHAALKCIGAEGHPTKEKNH